LVHIWKTYPRHDPPPAVLIHPDVTAQAGYLVPKLVNVDMQSALHGKERVQRVGLVKKEQPWVDGWIDLENLHPEKCQCSPKLLLVHLQYGRMDLHCGSMDCTWTPRDRSRVLFFRFRRRKIDHLGVVHHNGLIGGRFHPLPPGHALLFVSLLSPPALPRAEPRLDAFGGGPLDFV